MNLKDKFTFQFGGKTIQVEKLGEVHCAIHPRKGKDPLADPLMFSYSDLTNKEICIFKKSTKLMLTTVKASDITKPEPNEQKQLQFDKLELIGYIESNIKSIQQAIVCIIQDLEKLK